MNGNKNDSSISKIELGEDIHETNDFLSFDPHEWKQISENPVIYEALKDNIIVKFFDYTKKEDHSTQELNRLVFKKGEKVEVTTVGEKFRLIREDDEWPIGESHSLVINVDDDELSK